MQSGKLQSRLIANDIIIYLISAMIALGFMQLYLRQSIYEYVKTNITASNLLPYVFFILVFLCCALIGQVILRNKDWNATFKSMPNWLAYGLSGALVLVNLLLLLECYLHEVSLFDIPVTDLKYHNIEPVSVTVMAIVFIGVYLWIKRSRQIEKNQSKKEKLVFMGVCLFLGVVYVYCLYTPNVYHADYNLYHNSAYYNSVFSAIRGVPRTDLNSGVYGYYGFLLAPFVLLFGGTTQAFYIVITGFAALALFCMDYVAYTLIKQKVIQYLVVITYIIMVASMHWSIYLQLIPHRIIFPSFLTAFIVYVYKNRVTSHLVYALGYIICGLSIIWNFETGIICLFAYTCCFGLDLLKKYRLSEWRLYAHILERAGYAVLTFVAAWLFTGIVNILMGGTLLSFKTFLFPMFDSSYMTGYLTLDYQHGVVAWLFVAGLAFLFILFGLSKTKLNPIVARADAEKLEKSVEETGAFLNTGFVIAILTLGMMSYYINRPAYGNLTIVYIMMIIMVGMVADQCYQGFRKNENDSLFMHMLYRGMAAITVTVLTCILLGGAYNFKHCEGTRRDNDYLDVSQAEQTEQQIRAVCQPDTRAMGLSIANIYSDLGWNPYYYLIDFADLGVAPESFTYISDELNHNLEQPLLIDTVSMDLLKGNVDLSEFNRKFEVAHQFTLDNIVLNYYVPKAME